MRRFIPILGGVLLACATNTAPSPLLRLEPPGEISLWEGQSVELTTPAAGPLAIRITFVEVLGDSRCPDFAECIWAGDAAVRFDLSGPIEGTFVLHTPTEEIGPRTGTVGTYQVELIGLTAAPTAPSPRSRHDPYRATIRVTPGPLP